MTQQKEELYTLTIELEFYEQPSWIRVIEIPESADLYDLHLFIQEIVEFDDDHLFEFYAGRTSRNRKIFWGDDYGMGGDSPQGSFNTQLNQIYPLPKMKLFYLFDFGDCWTFTIKKSRKKRFVEAGTDYPRVIESHRENPEQYGFCDDEEY